jgi:hypothetical protein
VKTVISVDGTKPDVATARSNGLRYIHLPIGYEGVAEHRTLELAKVLHDAQGLVYIHCHHGQHRGPAAAAVACVVAGQMDNAQALEVMKTMGTGVQYPGLWASAKGARKADETMLRELKVEYRETAAVPPFAEAMVHLDGVFGHLELCGKAGWKKPTDHPDLDPVHEALQAREICAEIMRTAECAARPVDFRERMGSAQRAASELETFLGVPASNADSSREVADRAFARLRQCCGDCHKAYRNEVRRK